MYEKHLGTAAPGCPIERRSILAAVAQRSRRAGALAQCRWNRV